MKTKLIVLVLAVICLFSACGKEPFGVEDVTLKGRLVDCEGNGVPYYSFAVKNFGRLDESIGAMVSVYPITDKNGYFSVTANTTKGESITISPNSDYDMSFEEIEFKKAKSDKTLDAGTIQGSCITHVKAKVFNQCTSTNDSLTLHVLSGDKPYLEEYSFISQYSFSGEEIILPLMKSRQMGNDSVSIYVTKKNDRLVLASWKGLFNATQKQLVDFGTLNYTCDLTELSLTINGLTTLYNTSSGLNMEGTYAEYHSSFQKHALYFFLPNGFFNVGFNGNQPGIFSNTTNCDNPAAAGFYAPGIFNYTYNQQCPNPFTGSLTIDEVANQAGEYYRGSMVGTTEDANGNIIPFSATFKARRTN